MAKKSRNKNHSNNFHIKFMLYMHAVKAVHTIFVFGGKKLPQNASMDKNPDGIIMLIRPHPPAQPFKRGSEMVRPAKVQYLVVEIGDVIAPLRQVEDLRKRKLDLYIRTEENFHNRNVFLCRRPRLLSTHMNCYFHGIGCLFLGEKREKIVPQYYYID